MNATLTAISVFAEQLRNRPTNIQVTESFFLLLINLVSFFGNLLLGIVVIKNPTLRRTVPSMYIITLALSDFLNSCLGIPFSIASLIVGRWPFNDFVCQLQGFWILLLSAVSLQTLAVTAVNRCFRVGQDNNGKDGVKTNMPSRTCTKRKFSQEFEMDERKPE